MAECLVHAVVCSFRRECAGLALIYVAYVAATFVLSRGEKPVHADPREHEVPHDLTDSESADPSVRGGDPEGGYAALAGASAPVTTEQSDGSSRRGLLKQASASGDADSLAAPLLAGLEAAAASSGEQGTVARNGHAVAATIPAEQAPDTPHTQHSQKKNTSLFEQMLHPFSIMLAFTMPFVGRKGVSHYPKYLALLLPLTAPLFLVYSQGLLFDVLDSNAVMYGLVCGLVGSFILWSVYPSDGRLTGPLTGTATAKAFNARQCMHAIATKASTFGHAPLASLVSSPGGLAL